MIVIPKALVTFSFNVYKMQIDTKNKFCKLKKQKKLSDQKKIPIIYVNSLFAIT